MTKKEVPKMLQEMGIPFAYDHFAEGENIDTPFMVYLYPSSNHFAADGVAFYKKERLHRTKSTSPKKKNSPQSVLPEINFLSTAEPTSISTIPVTLLLNFWKNMLASASCGPVNSVLSRIKKPPLPSKTVLIFMSRRLISA